MVEPVSTAWFVVYDLYFDDPARELFGNKDSRTSRRATNGPSAHDRLMLEIAQEKAEKAAAAATAAASAARTSPRRSPT